MARSNKQNRRSKRTPVALAKSVRAYILSNLKVYDEEKDEMGEEGLFPPVDDGNMGVCAYIASATSGAAMLDIAKDLYPGVPIAQSFVFDPNTHSVVTVVASEDEPHLYLVVLDHATGSFTPITDINVVDMPSVSTEVFARCFDGISQDDADWGSLMTKLLNDGQYLRLGKNKASDLWWT